MTPGLSDKLHRVREDVRKRERMIVAFSGGVDSSLLASLAHEVLGDGAVAVIAKSPSLPRREFRIAQDVASAIGISLRAIDTFELENEAYARNDVDRCFFCKDELFRAIEAVQAETGIDCVAYGENAEDVGDHRPGRRAAANYGVVAPLRDAGLVKDEVRVLAKSYGLAVWDKPAFACLASRFPTGTRVTREVLDQVERSEDVLWELGFRQFRVRHHDAVARIEVPKEDLARLLAVGDDVVQALTSLGYRFVTMDLNGFRSGGTVLLEP